MSDDIPIEVHAGVLTEAQLAELEKSHKTPPMDIKGITPITGAISMPQMVWVATGIVGVTMTAQVVVPNIGNFRLRHTGT